MAAGKPRTERREPGTISIPCIPGEDEDQTLGRTAGSRRNRRLSGVTRDDVAVPTSVVFHSARNLPDDVPVHMLLRTANQDSGHPRPFYRGI